MRRRRGVAAGDSVARRAERARTARHAEWAAAVLLAAALACSATPPTQRGAAVDPRYQPVRGLLEVVAQLRRHISDDTYRFPAARDFTGRNVYRAALIRLENIERLHGDALRAGHMGGVIAFAKGRALERLRAFSLAAESYQSAAQYDAELRAEAERSGAMCRDLAAAIAIGFELGRPGPQGGPGTAPDDPDQMLRESERRLAALETLLARAAGTHYPSVIREEIERGDRARADYFEARRRLVPDGGVRALAEWQRLLTRHRDSKNQHRHLLALADFYATLAEEYVASRPTESLWFDAAAFRELADGAAKLYEVVANQDGKTEKLEAARRLEAFLAFTLRVDRERFDP